MWRAYEVLVRISEGAEKDAPACRVVKVGGLDLHSPTRGTHHAQTVHVHHKERNNLVIFEAWTEYLIKSDSSSDNHRKYDKLSVARHVVRVEFEYGMHLLNSMGFKKKTDRNFPRPQ